MCIVLSSLDIFLVFLLSPGPSDLFPRVVLFVLLVLVFFFRPKIFLCFFCLIIQVLSFCSCSFGKHRFFSQTNIIPAEIISFNSVMLFVEMCMNSSFFFFVSALTVF